MGKMEVTSLSDSLELSDDSSVQDPFAWLPALTNTATTMYRPLARELGGPEFAAFLRDLIDTDDTSDDDTDDTDDGDDSSDDGSGASEQYQGSRQGFGERPAYLRMVDLNRKRKRDEFESGGDLEILTQTEEVTVFWGRAGNSVDRPLVLDDDAAGNSSLAGAVECVVLSDPESDDDDCAILSSDGECDEESTARAIPAEAKRAGG